MPAAASPAPSCMSHPGFPVATTCGRASAREASLGASTARDIAGSSSVNSPALPQHWAASGMEITRSTGIARSIRSGGSAIRWACSRWQGGSYATVIERRAGPRAALGQELAHVPHAPGEPVAISGDVDQVPVLLQHRAAPRTVDDDGRVVAAERGDVRLGEAPGLVPQTGMRVQRTAAYLCRGFAYLVAVHLERADRGVVHVGEEALHYTTAKKQDGGGWGGRGRLGEVAP